MVDLFDRLQRISAVSGQVIEPLKYELGPDAAFYAMRV